MFEDMKSNHKKGVGKLKLFISTNFPAPYRIPLFKMLSEKIDVTVFFYRGKVNGHNWDANIKTDCFKYKFLKGYDFFGVFFSIINFFSFKKYDAYLLLDNGRETIFINYIYWIIASIRRAKVIFWVGHIDTAWSDNLSSKHPYILNVILNKLRQFLFQRADAFLSYSEMSSDHIVKYGGNLEKVSVGGQVMPENLLAGGGEKKKSQFVDSINGKVILSVGQLIDRKGVDTLIQAFRLLDMNDCTLVIVGDGSSRDRLESESSHLKNIIFTGIIPHADLGAYYHRADVFVLSTRHDPWAHVITEALYAGTPIVCSEAAGASSILTENDRIVVPDEPSVLSVAIKELLNQLSSSNKNKFMKIRKNTAPVDCNDGVHAIQNALSIAGINLDR